MDGHGAPREPHSLPALLKPETAVSLLEATPFEVNLRQVQNICYEVLQTTYSDSQERAERGDEAAQEWLDHFNDLGEKLSLRVI